MYTAKWIIGNNMSNLSDVTCLSVFSICAESALHRVVAP